jgi:hypothetical protein
MIRITGLVLVIATILSMAPFSLKTHFIQREKDIAERMMEDQIVQAKKTLKKTGVERRGDETPE